MSVQYSKERVKYVGKHLDIDSNPDYQYAIVFQLGDAFEGGNFEVYESMKSSEPFQVVSPSYGSITVSNSRARMLLLK